MRRSYLSHGRFQIFPCLKWLRGRGPFHKATPSQNKWDTPTWGHPTLLGKEIQEPSGGNAMSITHQKFANQGKPQIHFLEDDTYSPPRVDSSKGPHRVNRAHWPTKENRQNLYLFWVMCYFGGPLGIVFGFMGFFFGPLGKTCFESWASFLDP